MAGIPVRVGTRALSVWPGLHLLSLAAGDALQGFPYPEEQQLPRAPLEAQSTGWRRPGCSAAGSTRRGAGTRVRQHLLQLRLARPGHQHPPWTDPSKLTPPPYLSAGTIR